MRLLFAAAAAAAVSLTTGRFFVCDVLCTFLLNGRLFGRRVCLLLICFGFRFVSFFFFSRLLLIELHIRPLSLLFLCLEHGRSFRLHIAHGSVERAH